MNRPLWLPCHTLALALSLTFVLGAIVHAEDGRRIDFNHEIRPLLNKHCTKCHGGVKQAGEISFIYREQTLDAGIIVPGEPDESELINRVATDDSDLRMPPRGDGEDGLTQEEISLLRVWIAQGASWGDHWSLRPPEDHWTDARQDSEWPRATLDHFVLRRLQQEELAPSPQASPAEWLRSVSFDLIGLPPDSDELQAFEKALAAPDADHDAIYANIVDRLLASEHYGERWAALWMDLARYSDTMGFEKDPHRDMWPYRDWLIRAFNADMPFDEFTRKQLAGDLLPDGTTDDLIATAYHRNTQTNTEGGTDDEEFRVAAVIDRINTTWTVWLGTTFACVQCHSHPYDPYRNEEYYRFMAFFDNTEDHDLDDDYPTVRIDDDPEKRSQLRTWLSRRRDAAVAIQQRGHAIAKQSMWHDLLPTQAVSTHGTLAVDQATVVAAAGTFAPGCRYTIDAPARNSTAIRLRILPESDAPEHWPEVGSVVSRFQLELVSADGTATPLTISHAYPDYDTGPFDANESLQEGAAGFGGYPKLHGPRWVVFVLDAPCKAQPGDQFRFSILQAAQTTGSRAVHLRRLQLASSDDMAWTALHDDDTLIAKRQELARLEKRLSSLKGPRLPIIQDREGPATRVTRTFIRGNWLKRGEIQAPATPRVLPALSTEHPTRLDLANWLTSSKHPLTARVLANRLWATLFGRGIVETQEDFGSTGMPPSHPELLDHLALRLQRTHAWHWKPFLRELVLSSTYRQSHRIPPELLTRDPSNHLLARGPRTRLSAEMIRDQALTASGLLSGRIGGPSVMPPQPDGIWSTVYSNAQWKTAEGPDRYRRGIYTYWRRTSPYPSFLTFDAPTREFCSARRVATNTPLQALVTLNDPVYHECAAALAEKSLSETPNDPRASIAYAFQAVTQQMPSETALQVLLSLYDDALAETESVSRSAQDNAAESPHTAPQRHAMTIVANTLLNLDQALTK